MNLPADTLHFRYRENGQRIRRARHLVPGRNGNPISQEDFAKLIGTGRRHMIKLENGEHRPSGSMRDRIVEVTGTKEAIESSDDEEDDPLTRLLREEKDDLAVWLLRAVVNLKGQAA